MKQIKAGHPITMSADLVKENIDTLKHLFPTIIKEGKIDFDELKALLGEDVEVREEYYRFTWAGKAEARLEANKPSTGTLRPSKQKSKDWDNTQNIFIEGDNLEVLKLLQKSYAGKIKMIYIDPPYNTGKDFVYKDDYNDNLRNYLSITGQLDEDGNKIGTNAESDGRYHSNWLNMIYPRIKLARNLLKDDGVFFASIDNNEVHNFKKILDEVFGEENFVECIVWNKRIPKNDKGIGSIHEYILAYVKDSAHPHEFLMQKDGLEEIDELVAKLKKQNVPIPEAEEEIAKLYKKKGYDRGITLYNSLDYNYKLWGKINMSWPNAETFGPRYEVLHPKNKKAVKIPDRGWRWKEETFNDAAKRKDGIYTDIIELPDGTYMCGRIWFGKDEKTQPSSINYLQEVDKFLLRSILSYKSDGGIEIENLFDEKSYFSYPKPTSLLKAIINSIELNEETILDFFAGSGSTGDAIMQLNAEDGGNRKYILVQLPEPIHEDNGAFNEGYRTIANITNERLNRVGNQIKAEVDKLLFKGKNLDVGFKKFELDTSNIRAWDGSPDKLEENLFNTASNIKNDRTEEDVLYEILLKYGLDLSQPIEERVIAKKTVYSVGSGVLFLCLADGITKSVAEGIGKWKEELAPSTCKVIFKDSGLTDVEKTNSVQILKRYGITEVNSI